jgi:threonine dehydrogenase-like Zn-dependent dehydrogenase
MKAVVYHGPTNVSVDTVPDPTIKDPTDAVIKVTSTAICGSDLHLYGGMIPTIEEGDIFGHEFMGEVIETGTKVTKLKKGDRVIIPFPISCGKCFFCKNNLTSLCDESNPNHEIAEGVMGYSPSALYGYTHMLGGIPGGQAEYARVLFADANAFKVPTALSDEKVLFLTDIFPTGYMAAENAMKGIDIKTVAVFGCGPVGQFTIRSLFLLGAKRVIAIDKVPERLAMAEKGGAEAINYEDHKDIVEKLKEMTNRHGPDAVVDAVGMEASGVGPGEAYDKLKQAVKMESDRPIVLRQAIQACRKGGIISIPGVYSGLVDKIPMGSAMNKALTFYMGQTHVHRYLDTLLDLIQKEKIDPSSVITHSLPLEEAPEGYKIFREKKDNCIKIVLKPHGGNS